MSQESATSWVQVPMLERKAPVQSRRKLRKANGVRKPGSLSLRIKEGPSSPQAPALDRSSRVPVVDVHLERRDRRVAVAQGPRVRLGIGIGGGRPDVPEIGLVGGALPALELVLAGAQAVGHDLDPADGAGREVQGEEDAAR